MTRKRATDETSIPELNLAPIMNMVVILIPLLLLSIVFLKVGVINTSVPQLAPGPASEEAPTESLNLTVAVSADGFRIATMDAAMPPISSCPESGPTVCLANRDVDLSARFAASRAHARETDLGQAVSAYDWKELYNQLVRIKEQHADETTVNITADADVPYAVIVRVMDVARYRLSKDAYADNSDFWSAHYAGGARYAELFPDPVLAVAR